MLKVLTRRPGLFLLGLASFVLLLLVIIGFVVVNTANNSVNKPGSPVSLSGVNAASPGVTATPKQGGTEYLALGDSIAFGVGASSPQELGYPAVFYRDYLNKAMPGVTNYKNLAIPGETTTSFISRPQVKSQLDLALSELAAGQKSGSQVSLITLTIGGNDVLAARTKSAAEKEAVLKEFDTNFQKILVGLAPYTETGATQLIVTTYYNPFGNGSNDDAVWMQRFNDVIKQRAEEHKAKVADFFPPIVGQEKALTWIAGGDIHPNTPGHAALALALWQATGFTLPASTAINRGND